VEVIGHETKTVNAASKYFHCVLKYQIEAIAVPVLKEDRIPGVAAQDYVVNRAGEMNAGFPWH
jgi:hypothetical protein